MKSMIHCSATLAGLLVLTALAPAAWAKTIVVDSYGAAAFVSPGWHLVDHGSTSAPLQVGFGSPAALTGLYLYKEARRFAHNRVYARSAPAVGDGTSMAAPVQSDFRAMLLVGAVLVAHQLRRKHRSLKQSLIAG